MSKTQAFYREREALREKTHQLFCLLIAIQGTGEDGFHGLSHEIKEGYIDTCVEIAENCAALANGLTNPNEQGVAHA